MLNLSHPLMARLSHRKCWTVSDAKKRPINVALFIETNKIQLATEYDGSQFCTRDELDRNPHLALRTNDTVYIQAPIDGLCILDIEPICPDDIKHELLGLPWIYAERSRSGKGFHLILPLPKDYIKYGLKLAETKAIPSIQTVLVNNKPKPVYELLINHYCILTGDEIPRASFPQTKTDKDLDEFIDNTFDRYTPKALRTETKIADVEPESIKVITETQWAGFIQAIRYSLETIYCKSPNSFDGGGSMTDNEMQYIFGITGHIYSRLTTQYMPYIKTIIGHDPTLDEIAWIMYHISSATAHESVLQKRTNGRSALLHAAIEITKMRAEEQVRKNKQ